MNIWIVILIIVIAFILGYRFAMMRYRVKTAYKVLDLISDYFLGKIDLETLHEEYCKLFKNK